MGSTISVGADERADGELSIYVVGESALERLDVIRSGAIVEAIELEDRLDITVQTTVEDLAPGEYLYVRVLQRDGGAAWSSPIFVAAGEE